MLKDCSAPCPSFDWGRWLSTTDWLFFLLHKCGKYPFLSPSNPSILGSFDNALGKKLMESIILTRHQLKGCGQEEKHSIKGMQWIKYLSTTEGVHIQHSRNDGEKEIGSYKVDGYYENENGGLIISDCWTQFRKVSFSRTSLSNSHSHFPT
jgi:hypothetical protein